MFTDYIKIVCWWGLVEDVIFLVIGILDDTVKSIVSTFSLHIRDHYMQSKYNVIDFMECNSPVSCFCKEMYFFKWKRFCGCSAEFFESWTRTFSTPEITLFTISMVTEYIELNQLDVMNWYEFHPSQEIMISDLKVIIIYYCLIFLYYGKKKKKNQDQGVGSETSQLNRRYYNDIVLFFIV
jgi:hypothetical protein